MAITGQDLLEYNRQTDVQVGDQGLAETSVISAYHLVNKFIGLSVVPEDVVDLAVLECANELFYRSKAPQGEAQFATPDAPMIQRNRNPMARAYPILQPFVLGSFA